MKFKIKKFDFNLLNEMFNKDDLQEITLEPVMDTATQAVYEQHIKNQAFHQGIEYGYREGFYDGRCPERNYKYCSCCKCK